MGGVDWTSLNNLGRPGRRNSAALLFLTRLGAPTLLQPMNIKMIPIDPQEIPGFGGIFAHASEMVEDVEEGRAIMEGLFANFVGHLSDERWAEMQKECDKPCGNPDCQCHMVRQLLYPALNQLREEWKKITNERQGPTDEQQEIQE